LFAFGTNVIHLIGELTDPLQISKFATGVIAIGITPSFEREALGVHSNTPSKSRLPPNQVRNPNG